MDPDRSPPAWVLHVDLDQFLAAVEVRRRPELAGRPVVVGGDGDPHRPRQVVATASYEARASGVRSGMPLATALRRCPDAVFLPSDRPAYDAASVEVMEVLRSFGEPVEVLGWDEAFVACPTADPEAFAAEVRGRVQADTGLSCAVGIGETKLQAKTATGFAKPGGIARLTRASWLPTMGGRPARDLNGIGARTAARLDALGIHTVAELAAADPGELAGSFGPTIGPNLKLTGMGGHPTPVSGRPRRAKGRSREVTFTIDVDDPAVMAEQVGALAREVTRSVVADGRRVTHVAVKLRTASFVTRTRGTTLAATTDDPEVVAEVAIELLHRFRLDRPVRLLGVRVELDEPGTLEELDT